MKILVLLTVLGIAVADVSHLGYQYGPPNSYDVPQRSVTEAPLLSFHGSSPTSPSPSLHIPIHDFKQFNAQVSNTGNSGFYQLQSDVDANHIIVPSTPAPSVEFNQVRFGAEVPTIDLNSRTQAFDVNTPQFNSLPSVHLGAEVPTIHLNSRAQAFEVNAPQFNSVPSVHLGENIEYTRYSTPEVRFGSGELTSVNSALFEKDAAVNSIQAHTSGGSIKEAFGLSHSEDSHEAPQQIYQEPQVSKHLYFFAAPEEEEAVAPRINIVAPAPPKKNIKVIFIKAPSPPAAAPVHITAPQQSEEKTLVYVLVKKPEEQQDIQINTPLATESPKPEVYFIKYKSQVEAEEAIQRAKSGQSNAESQVIASHVQDSDFVNSINRESSFKAQPIINYIRTKGSQEIEPRQSITGFNSGLKPLSYDNTPTVNTRFAYSTASPILQQGSGVTVAPNFGVRSGFIASGQETKPLVTDSVKLVANAAESDFKPSLEQSVVQETPSSPNIAFGSAQAPEVEQSSDVTQELSGSTLAGSGEVVQSSNLNVDSSPDAKPDDAFQSVNHNSDIKIQFSSSEPGSSDVSQNFVSSEVGGIAVAPEYSVSQKVHEPVDVSIRGSFSTGIGGTTAVPFQTYGPPSSRK